MKTDIALISFVIVILCSSCRENEPINSPVISSPPQYKIVKGACGVVIYQENLGADYEAALKELEKIKSEYFLKSCPNAPCYEIILESFLLEVVDENNVKPTVQFNAIRVLDKKTKMLLHSVSEVITSDGNLYIISWCRED